MSNKLIANKNVAYDGLNSLIEWAQNHGWKYDDATVLFDGIDKIESYMTKTPMVVCHARWAFRDTGEEYIRYTEGKGEDCNLNEEEVAVLSGK